MTPAREIYLLQKKQMHRSSVNNSNAMNQKESREIVRTSSEMNVRKHPDVTCLRGCECGSRSATPEPQTLPLSFRRRPPTGVPLPFLSCFPSLRTQTPTLRAVNAHRTSSVFMRE